MTWVVETEASLYAIDMRGGTLTRLKKENPNPEWPDPVELRLDGEPIPLLWIEACDVGMPMLVFLDIRKDGVITWRRTTPVISVVNRPIEP